ncbi:MAG TPA: ATP-binding protein [Ramlibacter sp.]|nr:ATP-binding protein [Ramlibacter sp.]
MQFPQPVTQWFNDAWPTASLRTYLLAVILLATLPIAGIMCLQAFLEVSREQAQIKDELSRSAAALAQTVERQLESSTEALAVLSHSELFQGGRVQALGRLLQGKPRRDWDSVFLFDRNGELILDTAWPHTPGKAGEALDELRQRVTASGHAGVSGPIDAPPAGRAVAVAMPVMQNGAVHFVLGARMGEAAWQRLASVAGKPGGARATVFDAQDRPVAYSEGAAPGAASPAGFALPADAAESMRGRPSGLHRAGDVDGQLVYAAWQTVPISGWRVRVSLPAAPIDSAHRRAIVAALSTSGGSVLLGLLLASLVAQRIARPLRRLATRGPAGWSGPLPVLEVAMLRDALQQTRRTDTAAHDALQAKAQEFETLFNSSPIGMAFAQDPGCRVIWHNAAMDGLIGPRSSHRAGTVRVMHKSGLLAPGQQPLQRAAALGETIAGMELEIAIDGRPSTFVIANAVPLRDAGGRPRGAISALVDITQRKLVEERLLAIDQQLRESQRLMELAQEAGHVGFFHYQFSTDRLSWTPGQNKLFGIDQLVNGTLRDWFERIGDDDRDRIERELWTACAVQREKETLEYCVRRADGSERWLSSRVMLHYDAEGRAVQMTGVTVDMTHHKQVERERALLTEKALQARQDAEAASRAKDEFLTMLSHELRNPLGAISAAIDVLDAADPASRIGAEARAIITRQTRNLAHMMNDLLDVGRVIAGKILLSLEPVNLAAVVQRVAETQAITGEAKDHEVHLDLNEAWVDGDAVRIEQVVTNLMTNAVKYTPAGRTIHVKVLREASGMAVLQVRDAGMGIPQDLLPHIFDLFVQGQRTLDRRAGGLGIGLTLVRRLVELHGGTVGVESSESGTIFTVRLPLVHAPAQLSSEVLPPSRRRKVLVVEDNSDVLAALRSKLELDGHTVSTAADGIEGLSHLLKLRPEVSIVDIGLPGLTGFELARHARAAGYAGRMIAISGYGAERDAQEARVAGFDAYLVKPVDPVQLRASISAD